MVHEDRAGRPPTLEDVARRANVSRQTISRVINGKGEVSDATRQRVLAAIRELGYQPNALARSLATRSSPVLGLIVPDITQPFYPEIARGVEDGADAAGYSVFLCHTAGSPARELRALERLRGHRVGGVIICNSRLDDRTLERAVQGIFPAVLVNREVPNVRGTVIWPGYDTGGALATGHLIALGRRRIAYLGLDYENKVDQDKFRGYCLALEQTGLPLDPRLILRVQNTFHGGYEAMASLVREKIEVNGIFAFNDLMAIGAMRYAAEHAIAVPEEIALVGFGGSEVASMVTPGLTTISVPLYSIGTSAVQEIIGLIQGKEQEPRHVNVQPQLIVRGSSVADQQMTAM